MIDKGRGPCTLPHQPQGSKSGTECRERPLAQRLKYVMQSLGYHPNPNADSNICVQAKVWKRRFPSFHHMPADRGDDKLLNELP